MTLKGSYMFLGLGLTLSGVLLTLVSYIIIGSVPLTALGISAIILGAVASALGREQPKIPPELSAILLRSGLENTSAIIEELGLRSKAIYLPSSMTDGRQVALIPLHLNPEPPRLEKPLPRRLIVKYGQNPRDFGLLVTTPGSHVAEMLEPKPGPTLGELEAALSSILTGITGLADSVRVAINGDKVAVEAVNPHFKQEDFWVYEVLGSPLASVVASITAEVLERPVMITAERHGKGKSLIELDVLGEKA